jgi:hypothetical protein
MSISGTLSDGFKSFGRRCRPALAVRRVGCRRTGRLRIVMEPVVYLLNGQWAGSTLRRTILPHRFCQNTLGNPVSAIGNLKSDPRPNLSDGSSGLTATPDFVNHSNKSPSPRGFPLLDYFRFAHMRAQIQTQTEVQAGLQFLHLLFTSH